MDLYGQAQAKRGENGNSVKCISFMLVTPNLKSDWKKRQRTIVQRTVYEHYTVPRRAPIEDIEAKEEFIEEETLKRMEKVLELVKGSLNTVHTGKASPALLDQVEKLTKDYVKELEGMLTQ